MGACSNPGSGTISGRFPADIGLQADTWGDEEIEKDAYHVALLLTPDPFLLGIPLPHAVHAQLKVAEAVQGPI